MVVVVADEEEGERGRRGSLSSRPVLGRSRRRAELAASR